MKLGVHFQSRQNDKIQLIDIRTLVHRVCILTGSDFQIPGRIILQGLDCVKIEILRVHKFFNQSLFQKANHGSRYAAQPQQCH